MKTPEMTIVESRIRFTKKGAIFPWPKGFWHMTPEQAEYEQQRVNAITKATNQEK